MLFITTDQTGWGDVKRIEFTLSTNDTDYKEYIVPLESIEKWKGTATQLRFDVVNPVGDVDGGKVYIDSIEVLKEKP